MTDWCSTPSTDLGAFNFDPSPCPRNHHPLIDRHQFFALSVSLFAKDNKCFTIGNGVAPGGGNIFEQFFTSYSSL